MAELPGWSPLASVSPPAVDGSGRIVGVVASERAVKEGWAATAAVDLARSWCAAGQRVILVDATLQAPSLHEAAGVENREGLSDAALYGVSVARVSRPLDDGGLFLVTAGTPVADSRDVATSGRWQRLVEGMSEAGVVVLLYLRDGDAATAAFLGAASHIVVLSPPSDSLPAVVADLVPMVLAVTGPDGKASVGKAAAGKGKGAQSAPSPTASEPSGRSVSRPTAGEGGVSRTVLLVLGALAVAAGLGYLLISLL